jgi:probable HAF family extracellular repeat protein
VTSEKRILQRSSRQEQIRKMIWSGKTPTLAMQLQTTPMVQSLQAATSPMQKFRVGLVIATIAICHGLAAQSYTVEDMGLLFHPYGINNAGTAVGLKGSFAYVYSNGVLTDLGVFPGAQENLSDVDSVALGINQQGTVVGYSYYGASSIHAFSYEGETMTDLGTLGGSGSYATAINNSGVIVGYSDILATSLSTIHAFSYRDGAMTDLGSFGQSYCYPTAINSAGTIVGYFGPFGYGLHAFSYSNGEFTDLGTLNNTQDCIPSAINDAGTIVGYSYSSGAEIQLAFSCSNGVMTDLGTVNGGDGGAAYGINNPGDIVGESFVGGTSVAFLIRNGVLVDLNALVTVPGGSLTNATAINDLGQVVAVASNNHSYLLTPAADHFSVVAPATATTGVPLGVTVTAIDSYGNTAVNYGGIVELTSSDPAAELPASSILTNGTATFSVTLNTAGSQTVSAADTVTFAVSGTSSSVDVSAPTPIPTRAPTPTPRPSPAPVPSPTPAPSPTPGITPTPAPTRAPTPTPRPTPRPSAMPSETPTPAPTRAPTPTPRTSPTPRSSPTPSPAPT